VARELLAGSSRRIQLHGATRLHPTVLVHRKKTMFLHAFCVTRTAGGSVHGSQNSAVGIATGYWIVTEGSQFESRNGPKFFLLHVAQTCSGAHPAFSLMGACFPGVKKSGREATTSAEAKKTWIYTSTPPHVFMV
jgi:hypothetical protein